MNKEDFARAYGERFAQLDTNGDGSLSKQEFDDRNSGQVDASFSHLDGNNDGEVTKKEWQEARNTNQDSGAPVTIWYYYIY